MTGKRDRDADLLITYALHFECNPWQKLVSPALSVMKHMVYDVTDTQHQLDVQMFLLNRWQDSFTLAIQQQGYEELVAWITC